MTIQQPAILVVDDIGSMRNITITLLRSLKLQNVFGASNGAEALKFLGSHKIDIVLSDWNMPVMSGLELLKAVRGEKIFAQLPFIMITAEADRARVAEAIASGVTDLLVKPYTTAQLIDRIAKAMHWKSPGTQPIVPPPPASSQKAEVKYRPTILVVDDTPDNLHLLATLFKDEYRVRVADRGSKALEICCSDTPPDLVLLDVMMPEMDGFEVARRLCEHPNAEMIPVVFVTALNTDSARLKGLQLGAIDFVTKPIDPDVLKLRVRNLLRYVSLHKQLQANYDTMMELERLREYVEQMTRQDFKGPARILKVP